MSSISWDHSIRSFIRQAGSSEPTPGGGSVAALVAALGAAMTSMVGHLSQGEKFISVRPQIAEVIGRMEDLLEVCEELLAADISSFETYMDACKLPKNTDEEKNLRTQAIQQAIIAAIDVPLRLMEVCREGMQCTFHIAESSNKNVISDLGIGAILFEAAAQSALLTVEINLALLKDQNLKGLYADKTSSLIHSIEEIKGKILMVVRKRIAR
jgi:methenyltetrahydrofolate cyclohydrolase